MPSRKWQRNGLIDGRLGTYGKEEKEGRKERRKSFRGGPWRGSEMAATEFVIFENGQIIFLSLSDSHGMDGGTVALGGNKHPGGQRASAII